MARPKEMKAEFVAATAAQLARRLGFVRADVGIWQGARGLPRARLCVAGNVGRSLNPPGCCRSRLSRLMCSASSGMDEGSELGEDISARQVSAGRREGTEASRAPSNTQSRSMNQVVRARHILLETREMAEACQSQLVTQPELFSSLAKTMSKCPSGPAKGGDLGWVRRGEMVAPVNDALFDTSHPDNTPLVLESSFGWHVLEVQQRRAAPGAISAQEFLERFEIDELRESMQLIDVRERHELDYAKLPHFTLLPMSEYERWADSVESGRLFHKNTETIVMCHHGVRSAQIAAYLTQVGFTDVRNLVGGIDAIAQVSVVYTDRY
ncbi:Rhodanese-like/PpiC domain-containing protein 12, chloroplastic [Porphyridium purpureum]|uniref:Peptidyl-prolyl cis-trans isomerase C n=1 Tax=Porphyridium purpureum TaxID=35688 RepID=A0A5J4Z8Y9_PORPP|nr:Rhodanese-like/PpiC domain-containing protein 12, chloroplastic [Porphyridium purpureum]|eukprot:POR9792..scf295_1